MSRKRGAGEASSDWALAFYKTKADAVPARKFLAGCPQSVRLQLLAILVAVRDAPPPSFPTSNMWHAMRDNMKGFHEARDEHDGQLYWVFCVVDRQASGRGLDVPAVVLISGGEKPKGEAMKGAVYDEAVKNREDYTATGRILLPPGVPASMMKQA